MSFFVLHHPVDAENIPPGDHKEEALSIFSTGIRRQRPTGCPK
jgi:hypothetical protein